MTAGDHHFIRLQWKLCPAYKAFQENADDVKALLSWAEVNEEADSDTSLPADSSTQAMTKACFVLITAIWEAYCEDIAAEAVDHLVKRADPEKLPTELQKRIAKELKANPHELAVWRLAGQGWRTVISDHLARLTDERNRRMRTPKTAQINELFAAALGIATISGAWRVENRTADEASKRLDHYVNIRNEIAHRGTTGKKLNRQMAQDYFDLVQRIVSKTGGKVNGFLKKRTGTGLF